MVWSAAESFNESRRLPIRKNADGYMTAEPAQGNKDEYYGEVSQKNEL